MDKRKIFFLVLWIAVMLLPLEWMRDLFGLARRGFWILAGSELAHVIGHLALFGGMAVLVLAFFRPPLTWQTAILLALGVLAVGLGQEFLQLVVKGRAFGGPEVFDLGVDLTGAALGWLGYRHFQRYSRYLRIAYFILLDVR